MSETFLPIEDRVSRELDLDQLQKPLDLESVFGNSHPLEIEIGIGKGLYLMGAAQHLPNHNFIGIEISRKYLRMARERIEKRPIENVRFFCGEAHTFLEEWIPDESCWVLHIYYPDPWYKKRHHKRRLIQKAFLELVYRKLIPGGYLLIATDHAGYWEWIQEHLENQTLLLKDKRLPQPPPGFEGLTNYEIKYKREGRDIFRTGYRKPDVSG